MSAAAELAASLWNREPASRPDRVRIRARIAGMHCSLCTGTIEKALGRHAGVDKVGFVFLVLRSSGLARAVAGTAGAFAYTLMLFWLKQSGRLEGIDTWIAAGLEARVLSSISP